MPIELWLAFVAASAVMLIIPGPTILTVISYSMAHGRRANVPLVAAVALGDSTALAVSLLGLGALLATSAFWFTLIKWAGGLYLIYLGVKLLRAGISSTELAAPPAPQSRWRLFANTYLVTALNPKGIVFFVAFLPQFISPSVPVAPQLWVLAITFVVLRSAQRHAVRRVRGLGAPGAHLAARAAALSPRGRLAADGGGRVGPDGPARGLNQRTNERAGRLRPRWRSTPCR